MSKVVSIPGRRSDGFKAKRTTGFEDKYVYYKRAKKVIYADEKDKTSDVLGIKDILVVDHEVDIQEYVNSFADSVGPKAIVKKMQLGVDVSSELNAKPGIGKPGEIVDTTFLTADGGTSIDMITKAGEAYENLDPALKGDAKDVNEFLSNLTKEKVDSYIQYRIDALTAQGSSGGSNNE